LLIVLGRRAGAMRVSDMGGGSGGLGVEFGWVGLVVWVSIEVHVSCDGRDARLDMCE